MMKPKNTHSQRALFGGELAEILNHKHPLFILATKIDWSQFEAVIDPCYASDVGRRGISTRLMVDLRSFSAALFSFPYVLGVSNDEAYGLDYSWARPKPSYFGC